MLRLKRAVHPGVILKDERVGNRSDGTRASYQIEVPANRISRILAGKRDITADTALRLGHWFKTAPEFGLNLQAQFDLVAAMREAGDTVRNLPTRDRLARREPA